MTNTWTTSHSETGLHFSPTVRASPRAPHGPTALLNKLALILLVFGFAASLWLAFELTRLHVQHPDSINTPSHRAIEYKATGIFISRCIQIVSFLFAGVLACFAFRRRPGLRDPTLRILLYFLAAGTMAFRGFSVADLLSGKLLSNPTGPFPCFISALIFIGAERQNWNTIRRLITIVAVVLAAAVLAISVSTALYTRLEALHNLGIYLNALLFPAAWLLLERFPRSRPLRALRWAPVAIYALGTVLVQTRLNVVMLLALLAGYVYLNRGRRQTLTAIGCIAAGVGLSVVLLPLLSNSVLGESLSRNAILFQNRVHQDSRTGQLAQFFRDVKPSELLLGRGSNATWVWGHVRWAGGTDLGYLSLLFYGGIPLLVTYYLVHVAGALRCVRSPGSETHAGCAIIVLMWALRMYSSSYPALTVDYVVVLLCVGGCFAWRPGGDRLTPKCRGPIPE